MTEPRPEKDTQTAVGSSAVPASVAATPGSGPGLAGEASPASLPFARLTSVTRFVVRGLAEGALAGAVTGLLTGLLVLGALWALDGGGNVGELAVVFYVFALYGVIFGASAGVLAAAVLLAVLGSVVAIRPRARRWRGWPWLTGILVAVTVVGMIPVDAHSTSFLSGDVLTGVTLAMVAGTTTVWRTRAALRSYRDRTGSASTTTLRGDHGA